VIAVVLSVAGHVVSASCRVEKASGIAVAGISAGFISSPEIG
jgi:hypothetical protein